VSEREGNQEIYIMNSDGTGVRNLSQDPGDDTFLHGSLMSLFVDPWSPGGTKLAFASERTGNREIYVIREDGSGLTNVTNDPATDRFDGWAPSGDWIAFESDRNGPWHIFAVNPELGGRRRVKPLVAEGWKCFVEHDIHHITKSVAGSGRLRRPSTQPATGMGSWRRELVESKEAVPWNPVVGPVRQQPERYVKYLWSRDRLNLGFKFYEGIGEAQNPQNQPEHRSGLYGEGQRSKCTCDPMTRRSTLGQDEGESRSTVRLAVPVGPEQNPCLVDYSTEFWESKDASR